MVDIGGGSLELAAGLDEEPEAVMSLPLGAGRLTRDWFTADPPPAKEVRALRRHVRAEIARLAGGLRRGGAVDHAVGTSKTFRQLARIAGAAPSSEGFYAQAVPQAQRPGACGPSGWPRWTGPSGPGCPGCPRAGRRSCRPARSSPTP